MANKLRNVDRIVSSNGYVLEVDKLGYHPPAADGHSPDASYVMFGAGSNQNTVDMMQFSSAANAVDHGDLSQGRQQLAAASDGTKVMFGGGSTGSSTNTCDMKQFSSTATAVDHGDLSQGRQQLAAASDGTQVMFGGGSTGSVVNTCDLKLFSSNANAVDHGALSQARCYLVAGSGN